MTEPVSSADQPPFDMDEYRKRQRDRARLTGLALLALAFLTFFVTIAKIEVGG